MTSRERVVKALNFEEPDRVPIDLGGTIMTGIMAQALDRLRAYLKLTPRTVKVYEVYQMLGEVEADVVERLEVDVLPVEPLVQFFGLRRDSYKPWTLPEGTPVLVPGQFEVEIDANGDYLMHHEGDFQQPVEGRMPKNGFYFDMAATIEEHPDFKPPSLEELKGQDLLGSAELEFLQERAERLRRETDKALHLGCWGKLGLPSVGSIPDFLCLLASDRGYVRDLFAVRTETALANLEQLKSHLGDNIDIVGIDGNDYGSQRAELFSPDWFAELYVPFFRQQNDWIHANTRWKVWEHSCGSIAKIIPLLIEAGLDIINPVQCSATGMEPRQLKERFGDKIAFWGGGVDTQKTLPFGTAQDVEREVEERIRILAPGGGFVFNPIHNIQQGTPPENVVAAYDTAHRVGTYPLSPPTQN